MDLEGMMLRDTESFSMSQKTHHQRWNIFMDQSLSNMDHPTEQNFSPEQFFSFEVVLIQQPIMYQKLT